MGGSTVTQFPGKTPEQESCDDDLGLGIVGTAIGFGSTVFCHYRVKMSPGTHECPHSAL